MVLILPYNLIAEWKGAENTFEIPKKWDAVTENAVYEDCKHHYLSMVSIKKRREDSFNKNLTQGCYCVKENMINDISVNTYLNSRKYKLKKLYKYDKSIKGEEIKAYKIEIDSIKKAEKKCFIKKYKTK